jgi:flagellar hook-basal body complex protein FliE
MNTILKNADAKSWVSKANIQDSLIEIPIPQTNDAASGKSFMQVLADSLTQVNDLQKDANVAVEKLVSGESKDLHSTMIAMEKADLAFRSMNQIRQKVIDAYKDIMKMQV